MISRGCGKVRSLRAASLFVVVALSLCEVGSAATEPPAQKTVRFELPETDVGLPGQGPIRRYDWFRDLWNARRTHFAERAKVDAGAVVFLGDSITQMWGENLGGNFPELKTANRGISGDTTRGLLLRVKEDVLQLKPKAVVMLVGTNDLEEGAAPEVVASNIRLLLQSLHKHNRKMPVLLCEVFPSSPEKKRPADKIRRLNELYREVAKNFSQVSIVSTWSLFAKEKGDANPEEFPDLLHPNAAGYAKWVAALKPVLQARALAPTPK